MKPLTRSLLTSLLAFSVPAFTLHAQEPAGGDPFVKGSSPAVSGAKAKESESPDCLFVMDVYSLERKDAAAVLESERGSAARYRRVIDLMKAGKAKLEILTALATKSGQRSLSESIDEVVELNHVVECVTYPGDLKTPGAGVRYAPQPIFQTRKLMTSQGVPVGRRVLVGTLNPPASDGVSDLAGAGRVYLLFLRVTPNEP